MIIIFKVCLSNFVSSKYIVCVCLLVRGRGGAGLAQCNELPRDGPGSIPGEDGVKTELRGPS